MPKRNYQNAIFDGIDRFTRRNTRLFSIACRLHRRSPYRPRRYSLRCPSSQRTLNRSRTVCAGLSRSSILWSEITATAPWVKRVSPSSKDLERRQLADAERADLAGKVRLVAA